MSVTVDVLDGTSVEARQSLYSGPGTPDLSGRGGPVECDWAQPLLQIDPTALARLFDTSGTLVHMPDALPRRYCRGAVRGAMRVPFETYARTQNSTYYAPILKFGPTVFDYHGQDDKSGYFAQAASASTRGAVAFADAGVANPLTVALEALRASWPGPVRIAREPDGRPYFAGVMRDIPGGVIPHVDDATIETPDMAIGDITAQASMLFYVAMSSSGGALKLYDKTPTQLDWEEHAVGYGFTTASIDNVTFRGVTPGVGSVVLFPTTQIHSVDPATGEGRRITWSVFIGLRADGSLILWS